jgi:hypothetical protein
MLKKLTGGLLALGAIVIPTAKAYAQWESFFPAASQAAGGGSLESLISTVINAVLLIAGVVAVIYLIVGGYQYITSGGNAEQAQAGRTTVLNAIIGLVIIFAAFVVVRFVMQRIAPVQPI